MRAAVLFGRALGLWLVLLCPVQLLAGEAGAVTDSPAVVITGASEGVTRQLALMFRDDGYSVIATARSPARAATLASLGVRVEVLDVTSPESVAALRKLLKDQPVDILINGEGTISHASDAFDVLDIKLVDRVLDVNSLGPLRVTQALLNNLELGERKLVINIGSVLGAMEKNTWRCCLGYRASKTALRSLNKSLSIEFKSRGYTFVVLNPGHVRLPDGSGLGKYSIEESARGLYAVIGRLTPADTGKVIDLQGRVLEQ